MKIREAISNFIAHLTPFALVKQVFPMHDKSHAYTHSSHDNKPWMNVNEVELTAEDFA